jgi:hypothetical protein
MKTEIEILEDDGYDLNDEIAPEYDLDELRRRAKEEGREYRGIFWQRNLLSFGKFCLQKRAYFLENSLVFVNLFT